MKAPDWHYLTRDDICALRKVGRTRQFEDEKAERFPSGERHGMRTIRWRSDVVAQWMEEESQRRQAEADEMLRKQRESAKEGVKARRERRAALASELAGQA